MSSRWIERFAIAQVRHPYRFMLAGLLITIVAGIISAGLRIDASYEALLPQGTPELANVNDIRSKTGGTRQLVMAIGGASSEKRLEFARLLASRLSEVDHIRRVDLEFPTDFFRERAAWLIEDESLEELIVALDRALVLAREHGDPRGLGLAWGRIQDVLEDTREGLCPDRVLTSRDGRYTFLIVVPSINFYDVELGQMMMGDIRTVIEELESSGTGLEIRYAGNLPIVLEQQEQMTRDLRIAAVVALILGALLIICLTRRPLAPFLIGVPLLAGLTWSLAAARLLYGHLNVITGFLVAVLIGLGLDFGIHLFERYRQEALTWNMTNELDTLVVRFVTSTLLPALTSALTTAGTFFTFSFAQFRGFAEFGVIAGCGILLTLTSSFLLLPPLIIVTRRFRRRRHESQTSRWSLDRLRLPRLATASVVVLFSLVAMFGLSQVTSVSYRNDFHRLRGSSEATEFTEYVNENLGISFNPAVIVVDDLAGATRVASIIRARSDKLHENGNIHDDIRIERVLSLVDLLPRDVERRSIQLQRLKHLLDDPSLDALVERSEEYEARAAQLALGRRIVRSQPFSVDEIPTVFQSRFLTRDGSQYLVYVWPAERHDTDVQAVAWEQELAELDRRLRSAGVDAQIADETLITAWVHSLVSDDSPKLLLLASLVVFVFLFIDCRNLKETLILVSPLAVGMLGFIACLTLFDLEFNIFNVIVVPSIIGIGIDNSVHIYHRYKQEGPGSIIFVICRTGFAATIASLTTAIGFGSSMVSHHEGLRSLGFIAVLGIFFTLISALVFFPALLSLLEGRLDTQTSLRICNFKRHA